MAQAAASISSHTGTVVLESVASLGNMRALAWHGDVLYASRGYTLLCAEWKSAGFECHEVGRYRPEWWRSVSSRSALSFRLLRDGFHALAVTRTGNLVAAVPGAIATLRLGESAFQVTHRLQRGTRPLHIVALPDGQVLWGEYFDNPDRDEVHIYSSRDEGLSWEPVYTFPARSVRHIHNIIFDRWSQRLWIFTGDNGRECRVLRASLDFRSVDEVFAGTQQVRAAAALVTEHGIYFPSDTPLERNHIYLLDRADRLHRIASIPGSSISGAANRTGLFFSTMVEPSRVNLSEKVTLYGSCDGNAWNCLASWRKDRWSMKFFQYGNALFPDGENATDFLAVSTVAVTGADQRTSIYRTYRT